MSVEEAAKTVAGGVKSWIPWIALPVVVALVGAGVGVSGIVSHPTQHVVAIGSLTSVDKTTPGYSCPAGAPIAELDRGARVLAQERNDDSTWVSVRNPRNVGQELWVPVGMVVVDADQGPITDLPLGAGCPTISLVPAAPVEAPPVVVPPTKPTKPAPPAPTPDTTKPNVSVGSFSPQPVYGLTAPNPCATVATVTVTASDNIAVTNVAGTTNVAGATVTLASHSGTSWVFNFSATYLHGSDKTVTATFTATDAAGNAASAPRTLVLSSAGNCLI